MKMRRDYHDFIDKPDTHYPRSVSNIDCGFRFRMSQIRITRNRDGLHPSHPGTVAELKRSRKGCYFFDASPFG
jgi:hypothetical protein